MKLKRPRFPTIEGTAGHCFVHAGHRETAVEHAIEAIRDHAARARLSFAGDVVMSELEAPMEAWVIESLIQGAWLREYHEWEKATKGYFDGQHERNVSPKPNWQARLPGRSGGASHVERVRAQLMIFGAHVANDILDAIDDQRRLINVSKHDDEYFATEQDCRTLVDAIAAFWNELAQQEEITA
ncbi:hypothetical protein IVB43_30685 [Bradyrhizobium sp. 48]|uniref:hypothetical protein n=1 Tax=Bradyrhizobium sp. 48 TaxID=2782676 RepID=UPI001FFB0C7A|nr:hypothetical protein [Bradyrhizobium sp. 48]MCK1446739.1 hypothetical protein [Bradyrhizobium sp. 48]